MLPTFSMRERIVPTPSGILVSRHVDGLRVPGIETGRSEEVGTSAVQPRDIALMVAAALAVCSGLLLTMWGRPYRALLTTAHKLLSLVAVVIMAIAVFAARAEGFSAVAWTAIALSAAGVVACFASGAVLTGKKATPPWVLVTHRVVPWATVAVATAAVVIVSRGI